MGPHQDKGFCTAKETINKTKWQPTEWEKIFANDISEKVLVSEIYKELTKLKTQKTNNPVKKWEEDMNRHFSKEEVQMANRHTKRCSKSPSSGKYKSKPHVRYHLTPVRVAKMNKLRVDGSWKEGRALRRAPVGMSTGCCMETNLTINFILKKKKKSHYKKKRYVYHK